MIKYNCVDPKEKNKTFCSLPFQRLRINHLGGMTQCCYQGRDLGNIFDSGVLECWRGQLAREIQNSTNNGELHKVCVGWGGCPHIGKNLKDNHTHFEQHHDADFPLGLEIELPPTHCNIGGVSPSDESPACVMCPRNSQRYRDQLFFKENRYWEVVDRVKFLMPYLQQFTILGVAEPFWKNAIFETMDRLDFKSHQEHCQFWTFTNGSIFGPNAVKKYMEYVKYSLLNVSIDAATPETYMKIRRLDFYDTIKKNIKHYSEVRDKNNHRVKICHNINKLNYKEMPLMVAEAGEMGVDTVFFNPTHTAGGYTDLADIGLTKDDLPKFNQKKQAAQRAANRRGIQIENFRELEQSIESAMPRSKQLVQLNIP
jgi:hypothetical protein